MMRFLFIFLLLSGTAAIAQEKPSVPYKVEHNATTGEVRYIPLNAEELAELKARQDAAKNAPPPKPTTEERMQQLEDQIKELKGE
jgi:hypothetical protein